MNGKEISLGQRIFDLEDLGEVVNGAVGTFQGKAGLILQALCSVDTNRYALALVLALGHCFDVVEITDSPSKQLRGD